MVTRTVSVGLLANVNNFVAGMERAEAATKKTAAAAVGSEKSLRAQGEAFTKVGTLAMGAGAVAAAGLALVIKASADFGAKMAQLQTLSHASTDEMKRLSDAAMTAGTAYGFTATQVADAEIELTKAGIGVQAQLGGALRGALSLAAAGQMDVGQATEIATVAMTQFKLQAKDVPHLADLLAAGADKALGSVADLGEGLKNGGLQAHNMGLSIDDTVGLLSAFANVGILGAEAGTQMRSMFLRLENPTSAAQKTLHKYGIEINDASGKFVGITKFAGELHDQLDKVSPATRNAALATVFGSHAIIGATALYQYGAKGIGNWIKAVNDSGFANAQAAGKLNSLTGDVQKLSAAFQTDLIKAGTDASGSLRGVVQSATGLLDFVGGLPQPLKDVGVGLTVVVASVGLLGGAALIAVPKVLAFKTAMTEANITGKGLAGTFGKGGALVLGLVAVAGGFSALAQEGTASTQDIEVAATQIEAKWTKVGALFKGDGGLFETGGAKRALDDSFGNGGWNNSAAAKFLDGATFGISHFSDVYKSNESKFDAFGQQLAGLSRQNFGAAAASFNGLVKQFGGGQKTAEELLRSMPAFREQLTTLAGKAHVAATDQNLLNIAQGKGSAAAKVAAEAAREAADAANKQSQELAQLTGSGNDATQSMKSLHDALAGLGSTELDARSAARQFQQAIDDATAAAKKNGKTLDINTQAGRDNQQMLDGIASSARDSAAAYVSNSGSAKGAAAIVAAGRSAYVRTAEAMGLSKKAANQLADSLHLIPKDINTIVRVSGASDAAARIADIKSRMNNLQGTTADIYINAVQTGSSSARASQIARNAGFAAGGAIGGAGPKGVDSVPALLAPGEHVLTAREVDAMGGQSGVYAFRASLGAGPVQRFAAGGAVAQAREDFISAQRRAYGNPIDPLSYVDDLRQMSRGTDFSAAKRRTFDAAANKFEGAMVHLAFQSSAAATKLADLKNSAAQMKSSIASAISGGYQASGAGSSMTPSGWAYSGGVRYRTYSSGTSAASLASYYKAGATSTATFAAHLKTLASRGVNGSLLAEIAGYGVDQGGPIAAALLTASKGQLATINSGYSAIQKNAGTAGTTVANDNYAKQIAAADKNAKKIADQLKSDGEKLRRLIARAFGLKGYASGTDSATPGFHIVGENGPELVRFRGGERVWTAGQTAYMRGTAHAGRAPQVHVEAPIIRYPDTITVQDASGFRVEMQVVAKQTFHTEMTAGAVHLNGIA